MFWNIMFAAPEGLMIIVYRHKSCILYWCGLIAIILARGLGTISWIYFCTCNQKLLAIACCCCPPNHYKILHMPRQLSCRGMCKTWSDGLFVIMLQQNIAMVFSITSKKSLVPLTPGLPSSILLPNMGLKTKPLSRIILCLNLHVILWWLVVM